MTLPCTQESSTYLREWSFLEQLDPKRLERLRSSFLGDYSASHNLPHSSGASVGRASVGCEMYSRATPLQIVR